MRKSTKSATPCFCILKLLVLCSLLLCSGCSLLTHATATILPPTNVPPTIVVEDALQTVSGLTNDQVATLSSLQKIDDYPLYTMRFYGAYSSSQTSSLRAPVEISSQYPSPDRYTLTNTWGCSLFAALFDPNNQLFGRNFDWEFSPALLLFTDPPDGYASVSMVDIAYLDFDGLAAYGILDLPLIERRNLLAAPFLPFDGMNEHGLAIGMAAVPPGFMQSDPTKETVDSLHIMRLILDRARDVEGAIDILGSYNIDMEGGPPLHYLIADAAGNAALVEFYRGEMFVIPNEGLYHHATNFLRSADLEHPQGQCWRYDTLTGRLAQNKGELSEDEAISLLAEVAQDNTQWSIVYEMSTGDINVAMKRQFDQVHQLNLQLIGDE